MKEYITKMDETYRSKQYPAGSVFEKAAGENRRGNITLAILSGVVSILLAAVIVFLVSLTLTRKAEGNSDAIMIGTIFIVVVAALLALCLFGMVAAIRHIKDGVGDIIRKSAKTSGLSESDIRHFDQQAMQSDSCVLSLTGKLSAAMANQKDGILTRDYLWLGDRANTVFKREEIVGVSLYHWYYYVNKKRVRSLNLAVLNGKNALASVEVTEEGGRELMELLAQGHPSIQVHQGILEEGKEYDAWRNGFFEKK